MGICLIMGGSRWLPGWFGALMPVRNFMFFSEGLPSSIWCINSLLNKCRPYITISGSIQPFKMVKIVPENKCPRVPVWVKGGGVRSLFGQCPNRPDLFQTGASLISIVRNMYKGPSSSQGQSWPWAHFPGEIRSDLTFPQRDLTDGQWQLGPHRRTGVPHLCY